MTSRRRKSRLAAITALALLIAPGNWWRSAPEADTTHAVKFVRLPGATPRDWPAGLTLAEAWQLAGANSAFAGFSALVLEDSGFRGFTDFGGSARFPRPSDHTIRVPVAALPATPAIAYTPDVEAAVQDHASGTLWLSYEFHNAVRRIGAAGATGGSGAFVRPPALSKLGENSGVEAMARLSDGRFLMLAERGGKGFLFAGDPVEGPRVRQFAVGLPQDFRPTDMAALPDGRVLVLLRRLTWGFPPVSSMLAIGDPATIGEHGVWQLEPLATIDQPGLRENYEGLAVEQAGDGAFILWLISDSNRSVIQRTLLLKLRWQPETKTAREEHPREPQNP